MESDHLWAEWHLVPCGWVKGSEKTEFGSVFEVEAPDDRVITCRLDQYEEPDGSVIRQEVTPVWRSADEAAVNKLVTIFGDCPRSM
ncbi:MAG TPA: hypothetical protein VNX25_02420 [Verrucomicrobiae bacterium]|nr:hypothetical protein [Verrucomicrobiae bacterium]